MKAQIERAISTLTVNAVRTYGYKPPFTASLIDGNGQRIDFEVPDDCAVGQNPDVEKLSFPIEVIVRDREGKSVSVPVQVGDFIP